MANSNITKRALATSLRELLAEQSFDKINVAQICERWAFIEKICRYFYQNHTFYRKALQIKGQNSFRDHFREYIQPLLADRISSLFGQEQPDQFTMDFLRTQYFAPWNGGC